MGSLVQVPHWREELAVISEHFEACKSVAPREFAWL